MIPNSLSRFRDRTMGFLLIDLLNGYLFLAVDK